MKPYLGTAKVGKDMRPYLPPELIRELDIKPGDKIIFTKLDCGAVVTKNEVP